MKRFLILLLTLSVLWLPAEARRRWIPKPVSGGASYLLDDPLTSGSGSTPATGWTAPDGTWTWNGNATAGPDAFGGYAYRSYTTQTGTVYFFCKFNQASQAGSARAIYALSSAVNTDVVWVSVLSDGRLAIFDSSFTGYSTVSTIPSATDIYIWASYVPGSTMSVAFSTTGTRPTSGNAFVSGSTSVSTNVSYATMRYGADTIAYTWTRIIVNPTLIGDNP